MYSGASFNRTFWFLFKIVRIGEASRYLKCYDMSLKEKCMYCITLYKGYTKDNFYI